MHNQVVRLSAARAVRGAAVVIVVVTLGVWSAAAQAAEAGLDAHVASAAADAPRKVDKAPAAATGAARPAPPRREPRRASGLADDNDAYRCHPAEDIACTVVRETAGGMTIVTMRPSSATAQPPSWSVVSGTPPGASAYPGGIIYVVPQALTGPARFEALPPTNREVTLVTANDAPILD